MDISDIKTKGNELKVEIENALTKFQAATGETAMIHIKINEEQTRCGVIKYQTVTVAIELTD